MTILNISVLKAHRLLVLTFASIMELVQTQDCVEMLVQADIYESTVAVQLLDCRFDIERLETNIKCCNLFSNSIEQHSIVRHNNMCIYSMFALCMQT